jgi:4-hydroxy-3-methylbut-2-enyl diphosphate reductase
MTLLIAAPRGFCAGVDRAIRIVELALERYGAPVYVRHEIVHNKYVVDSLRPKARSLSRTGRGAGRRAGGVSAHGVPKAVPAKAEERGLDYLECDLPPRLQGPSPGGAAGGRRAAHLFIGHAGHPEVIGTFGQVPEGQDDFGGDAGGRRGDTARRSRQPRLSHPDDAVGGRHA